MVYHILNGDALAYSFPEAEIEGEIIVVREALVDGQLSGETLHEFWRSRAAFLQVTEAEYHDLVVHEFKKIMNATGHPEFNLWFEFDLFCQVNMWFVMSLIKDLPMTTKVFVVLTSYLDKTSEKFWNGFGPAAAADLKICHANKVLLGDDDLALGQQLWMAYKKLTDLSRYQSPAFPYLSEVIAAHVERFPVDGAAGRPEKVIEYIVSNISTDFSRVFQEFWRRESIYGFGDTQVKSLYDKVMQSR
jgi:hypothetical protein